MPSKPAAYRREGVRKKMLISAEDYQRMGAAGIFDDKPRVELIDGQIYAMSPFTPYHNGHVDKCAEFFTVNLFGKAKIRTQGSVRIDDYTEPEPDIALLRFSENFYSDRQATAKDVLLLIEVAVHTLETDRTAKLQKYAASNIPEYWIVIPEKGIVEVYRKPKDGVYLEKNTYKKADEWVFETFKLPVKGTDLLI
ncbi:MAG: Uma2 family endonuclease [Lewinellaceae bacterium]|nr:Uma2 family endonuclease [Phaeodactylibacter sp.]MCB9350193.1 Uma2 family endonuclease [Lewinellaceae bacterium]